LDKDFKNGAVDRGYICYFEVLFSGAGDYMRLQHNNIVGGLWYNHKMKEQ
jgi:hypothetical protein